jgi:osmotically-inducible protein OsmY
MPSTARKTAPGVLAALSVAWLLSASPAAAEAMAGNSPEVAEALATVAVRAALIERLGVDALRIRVSVSGETAELTGETTRSASQGLAGQVARSVRGVRKVENRVTQQNADAAPGAAEASARNVALEMKVKAILLGEFGASALRIGVAAVNGAVSLRGKLDRAETGRAAVERTRSIQGVRAVVDLLG